MMDQTQRTAVESAGKRWNDRLTSDERTRATCVAKRLFAAHGPWDEIPDCNAPTPGRVRLVLIRSTKGDEAKWSGEQREAKTLLDLDWQVRMANDLGRPVCGVAPRKPKAPSGAKPRPNTKPVTSVTTTVKSSVPKTMSATVECPECHQKSAVTQLDKITDHITSTCSACAYAFDSNAPRPAATVPTGTSSRSETTAMTTTKIDTTLSSDEAEFCRRLRTEPRNFIDSREAAKLGMSTQQYRQLKDAGQDPARIARDRDAKSAAKARERAQSSLKRLGIDPAKLDTVEV